MRGLVEVAADAGITYRQADYWVRAGYITARPVCSTGEDAPTGAGSGYARLVESDEEIVLVVMADLVREGFRAERAAIVARSLFEGHGSCALGKTLQLCHAIGDAP